MQILQVWYWRVYCFVQVPTLLSQLISKTYTHTIWISCRCCVVAIPCTCSYQLQASIVPFGESSSVPVQFDLIRYQTDSPEHFEYGFDTDLPDVELRIPGNVSAGMGSIWMYDNLTLLVLGTATIQLGPFNGATLEFTYVSCVMPHFHAALMKIVCVFI